MSWAYRCSKCRGRNTLAQKFEHYKRTPKCRHCGWFRFYLDKARQYRTDYCTCESYHYTHRKGSKFCVHNKDYEFNVRVGRYNEDPALVRLEVAFDTPALTTTEEVPF